MNLKNYLLQQIWYTDHEIGFKKIDCNDVVLNLKLSGSQQTRMKYLQREYLELLGSQKLKHELGCLKNRFARL